MKVSILLFGDSIVHTDDIVEISEKKISFNIKHSKKNPAPKPTGFFARMAYSDEITYYKEESYFALVLKVKGRVQMRGQVDDCGNVSMKSNQLYDFYTIYNDEKLIQRVKQDIASGNTDKVCEMGNFFVYFGILCYPDYLSTNVMLDKSIKSKRDFLEKYM